MLLKDKDLVLDEWFKKQARSFGVNLLHIRQEIKESNNPKECYEFLKCKFDPSYFLNNYAVISHPTKGHVRFTLYDFQKELINIFLKNQYVVINKARQMGISTLTCGYTAWMMNFWDARNILSLSIKKELSQGLLKKIKLIYKHLPSFLFSKTYAENSKTVIELDNDSRIRSLPKGSEVGRSEATSLLIYDEAAMVENAEEVWISIEPSLSEGGQCIMLSTPKGVGNLFHKLCAAAKRKENDFVYYELPWHRHPLRDEAWKQKQIDAIGIESFEQEFNCKFSATTNNFISLNTLEKYYEIHIREPIKTIQNGLWIWEEPKDTNNFTYIVGVDTATGDAREFSTFSILKVDKSGYIEQVAEYKGKTDYIDLAKMIYLTGKLYNFPLMVVETNGIGNSTYRALKRLNYPYMYDEENRSSITKTIFSSGRGSGIGVFTNTNNRPTILANLKRLILNNYFIFHSTRLLSELQTFVIKNDKPVHEIGYFDDCIFASALGIYVLDKMGYITYQIENDVKFEGDISEFFLPFIAETQEHVSSTTLQNTQYSNRQKQNSYNSMKYNFDHSEKTFPAFFGSSAQSNDKEDIEKKIEKKKLNVDDLLDLMFKQQTSNERKNY